MILILNYGTLLFNKSLTQINEMTNRENNKNNNHSFDRLIVGKKKLYIL